MDGNCFVGLEELVACGEEDPQVLEMSEVTDAVDEEEIIQLEV